jgi:NAD(P)-dependent dehydrogenase (short-subunit alcohol dehydrogenase family)
LRRRQRRQAGIPIAIADPALRSPRRLGDTNIKYPGQHFGASFIEHEKFAHALRQRVVFIYGGSSGIGTEQVRAFAAQGSQVAFCGTKQAGGDALIGELTPEYWDNCLNLNLRHQVFATQTVARQLRNAKVGGSVINMGSISRMRGRPNLIGYTASKAAISGMTRTLARELGGDGIRVNALVPGAIVTERQTALWRNPEEDQKFIDLQCLKFRLDSTHVARSTLFLAADDSDGITGQNLIVDAGLAQVSVAG